jgi:pilus assembly protein CpaC
MKRLLPFSIMLSMVVLTSIAAAPRALAQAVDLGPASSRLSLEIGQGRLIRLGAPAKSVFLANPAVADVDVKSPTLVYVTAKAPGATNLIAVDGFGRVEANIQVSADYDATGLADDLRRLDPGANVKVTTSDQALVLSGSADSAADAETAKEIASHYAPDAKHLVNLISVDAPNQINLRVRVAEVSRQVIKQFGFSWGATGANGRFAFGVQTGNNAAININQTATGASGTNTITNPTGLDSIFLGYNSGLVDLNLLIDALESENLVTVLAEPNLTATSGSPANFLAGGEYPIPVPQSLGVTTIEYKNYGVSLNFVATIVDGGRINLKVAPEVSELSTQGEITLDGETIPALTTRRAETTVDLASGQSLAIAGLLQNNYTQSLSKFPGLGNVPVLGALFRSDSFEHDETELVIIVTPYIVKPSSGRLAAPTDGYAPPTDAARLLYGADYTAHAQAGRAPLALSGRTLIGPSGFELE